MIMKKSQMRKGETECAEIPKKQSAYKISKRVSSESVQESIVAEVENTTSLAGGKVRLSADIDHKSYIKIKNYSAVTRRPVVAIVQDLINKHCEL